MGKNRRTVFSVMAALAVLGALSLLGVVILTPLWPRAHWLVVEGPSSVTPDTVVDLRVTLGKIPEPTFIGAILCLEGPRRRALASINLRQSLPAVRSGETCVLSFFLRNEPGLKSVYAIIVLTPTRGWPDRTHAASTERVPLRTAGADAAGAGTRVLTSYAYGLSRSKGATPPAGVRTGARRGPRETPPPVRAALFALLAAGALASYLLAFRPVGGRTGRNPKSLELGLGIFLLLAGLSEVLALDHRLTDLLRALARQHNYYYIRRSFQFWLTLLLLMIAASLLSVSIRALVRRRLRFGPWLTGAGLAGYLAVVLAQIISFHYADRVFRIPVAGIPAIDILKGAGALTVLVGLVLGLRGQPEGPGPAPDAGR